MLEAKFKTWTRALGLCDVWRTWNPDTIQYNHTSAAHGTHSRLDYFLMSASDVSKTSGSLILPRVISDHSPVQMSMGGALASRRSKWRLNVWFLQDPKITGLLKTDIQQYFQLNVGSFESPGLLSVASKATIRGAAKDHVRGQERDRLQ